MIAAAGLLLAATSPVVAEAPAWTYGHIVGLPQAVLSSADPERIDVMLTCVGRHTLLVEVTSSIPVISGTASLTGDGVSLVARYDRQPYPDGPYLRAAFPAPPDVRQAVVGAPTLTFRLAGAGESVIPGADPAVRRLVQDCLA